MKKTINELKWVNLKKHLKSRKGKILLLVGFYAFCLTSYLIYNRIVKSESFRLGQIERKSYFHSSRVKTNDPIYSLYQSKFQAVDKLDFNEWRDKSKKILTELFEIQPDSNKFEIKIARQWQKENLNFSVYKIKSPVTQDSIILYEISKQDFSKDSLPALFFIPGTGRFSSLGLIGEIEDYHNQAAVESARLGYKTFVFVRYGSVQRDIIVPDYLHDYDKQTIIGQRGIFGLNRTFASIIINECLLTTRIIHQMNPDQKIVVIGVSAGAFSASVVNALSNYTAAGVYRSGLIDNSQVVSFSGDNQPIPPQFSKFFNDFDIPFISYPKKSFIMFGRKNIGNIKPDPIYQEMDVDRIRENYAIAKDKYHLNGFIDIDKNNNGHEFDDFDKIDAWLKSELN